MTADEFRVWPGDGKGGKYELVDGELRMMSPEAATHGRIQGTLGGIIRAHLLGIQSRCGLYTEPAIAVRIRAKINTRVPDLGVSCASVGPVDVELPDPILLIEILSPGNKADTWSNVWAYCSIPTVAEILIVSSTRIEAQLLRRDADGHWPKDPTKIEAEGLLTLDSIGLTVPLVEVYAGTYLVG